MPLSNEEFLALAQKILTIKKTYPLSEHMKRFEELLLSIENDEDKFAFVEKIQTNKTFGPIFLKLYQKYLENQDSSESNEVNVSTPPASPPLRATFGTVRSKNVAPPAAAAAVPLTGFCPLRNPSNYCYMNSSMQLLFNIPEFRETFLTLTEKRIIDSGVRLTPEDRQKQPTINLLLSIKRVMGAMQEYVNKKTAKSQTQLSPVDMATGVKGPSGHSVYWDIIEIITSEQEKKDRSEGFLQYVPFYVNPRDPKLTKQSDADELIRRVFDILFYSDIPDIVTLRNLFLLREVGQTGKQTLTTTLQINAASNDPPVSFEKAFESANVALVPFSKYIVFVVARLKVDPETLKQEKVHTPVQPSPIIRKGDKIYKIKSAVVHYGDEERGHYNCYHFDDAGLPFILVNDHTVNNVEDKDSAIDAISRGCTVVSYERVDKGTADLKGLASAATDREMGELASVKNEFRRLLQKRSDLKPQLKPFDDQIGAINKVWTKTCSGIFRTINMTQEKILEIQTKLGLSDEALVASYRKTLGEELSLEQAKLAAAQAEFASENCQELQDRLRNAEARKKVIGNQNAAAALEVNTLQARVLGAINRGGSRTRKHRRSKKRHTRKH